MAGLAGNERVDEGNDAKLSAEDSRPSFEDFWKKAVESQAQTKNITFAPPQISGTPYGEEPASATTQQEKAQARRAQVRRAQLQHRQRKANYTRQLEDDVGQLRKKIEETEADIEALRQENAAIRERLAASRQVPLNANAVNVDLTQQFHQSVGLDAQPKLNQPSVSEEVPDAAAMPSSVPEYTVSMSMGTMGTPAFQVARPSHRHSRHGSRRSGSSRSSSNLATGLTADQTDLVINFILSLEHICWDHFDPSYWNSNDAEREHGHSLMASSLALQQAPTRIFNRIDSVQSELHADPMSSPATSDISWRSNQLTLESIFALAQTLSSAEVELAPVQAWFEIVNAYGPEVGLSPLLLERMKYEFRGVVKCLHFGAVIERDAFDSIVSRVVGGVPQIMDA